MNNAARDQLSAAYQKTNYVVDDGKYKIIIRIGEANLWLDELLNNFGSCSWAFITAYNPCSTLLSEEENRIRQSALLEELKERKFRFLTGYGQGFDAQWPAEPSIFIIDIDRATAVSLGSKYGQNAIVAGEIKNVPELVWCLHEKELLFEENL